MPLPPPTINPYTGRQEAKLAEAPLKRLDAEAREKWAHTMVPNANAKNPTKNASFVMNQSQASQFANTSFTRAD